MYFLKQNITAAGKHNIVAAGNQNITAVGITAVGNQNIMVAKKNGRKTSKYTRPVAQAHINASFRGSNGPPSQDWTGAALNGYFCRVVSYWCWGLWVFENGIVRYA